MKHDTKNQKPHHKIREGRVYTLAKRTLDIGVAAIALILFAPLFAVIALTIKFDSKGPVLFKQTRIGMNRRRHRNGVLLRDRRNGLGLKGRPFHMYKFRTMHVDIVHYDLTPTGNKDPRLTKVGVFLRRYCLDELPQFINVLIGDMSLVGPRPEMPFMVRQYHDIHALRLLVKPGITGLWQLDGPRDRFIHEEIDYDLRYLKSRGFLFDAKIIAKTIPYVLFNENI